MSVRESGDVVTSIRADQLVEAPRDERVTIHCDGHVTAGIFAADHSEPQMTFLAVLNSEGQLELSLVGDSAAKFLGFRPGAVVTVKW